jgi:hypothetical protein
VFDLVTYSIPENIESQIDFGHSLILKRCDGIIEIRCADDFTYDVAHIIENHNYLKSICNNHKLLILNFTSPYTSITSEARTYIAKGKHQSFIVAEAFLIHSLPQRILANFFTRISQPKVYSSFFNYKDKESAEKWLIQFKNQE